MRRWRTRSAEISRLLDRRSGAIPGRRLAFATALALAVFVPAAAAVADDTAVHATIFGGKGGPPQESVTLATLQGESQQCPPYSGPAMKVSPNSTFQPPAQTWALATVLSCMQPAIDPRSVTAITVLGADGTPEVAPNSQLTPPDLEVAPDQPAPIVTFESPGTGQTLFEYTRPQRNSSDDNGADQFQTDAAIEIDIFEGPTLNVTVTPSNANINVGGIVTFTASVSGAGSSPLTYDWSFDGPAPSTAASPSISFPTSGTFDVGLEVYDPATGAVGTAATTVITVAGGPQQTTTTPAAAPGGNPHGSGTSPHGATSGHHHSSGSGGGSPSKASKTPTTAPTTTTSPIPSSATPASPSAPAVHPRARSGAHQQAPAPKLPSSPSPSSGTVPVVGRLIADPRALTLGASKLIHNLTTPGPVVRASASISPLAAIAGSAVALLLLSLGAAVELRGRRALRLGS